MKLLGEALQHKTYGKGVITGCQENVLTICFSAGEKKFFYPDAFDHFLTLKDPKKQHELETILQKQRNAHHRQEEKLHLRRALLLAQQEKLNELENIKISTCGQAVFDVSHTKPAHPIEEGYIFCGRILSGQSKGEVRTPDRMKPNSLCLVTRCPENAPETQREILGGFMVPGDFIGTNCRDGIIHAHHDYHFTLEKPLPFWSFVKKQPSKNGWGGTAFKYFNNEEISELLYTCLKQIQTKENTPWTEEFYRYYCRKNHLAPRPDFFA